jgi:hypothetical protein
MPINQIDGCEIHGIVIDFFDAKWAEQFSSGGPKPSISRQMAWPSGAHSARCGVALCLATALDIFTTAEPRQVKTLGRPLW